MRLLLNVWSKIDNKLEEINFKILKIILKVWHKYAILLVKKPIIFPRHLNSLLND